MKRKLTTAVALCVLAAVPIWHVADRARGRPNILLITVETLRRDHCSLYGYERDTTPFLRKLAEESIVFDNAWSHSSWTYPSMACVLSGRLPQHTGIYHEASQPGQDLLPWVSRLRGDGYRVAAITSNTFVRRLTITHQGWDGSWHKWRPRARWLMGRILSFASAGSDEPWFCICHVFDPHSPYSAPAATAGRYRGDYSGRLAVDKLTPPNIMMQRPISGAEKQYILGRYDEEIRYVDDQLRCLVRLLRRYGAWKNTCLILTADHGESFGARDWWGHGGAPYRNVTAVPFLVRLPGGRHGGTRTDALVGGIDVLPTLLSQAGVPVPKDLPGVDAVSLLDNPRAGRMLEQQFARVHWLDEAEMIYRISLRARGGLWGRLHRVWELPADPPHAVQHTGDATVLADLRDLGYL